jgi:hypothetical protein
VQFRPHLGNWYSIQDHLSRLFSHEERETTIVEDTLPFVIARVLSFFFTRWKHGISLVRKTKLPRSNLRNCHSPNGIGDNPAIFPMIILILSSMYYRTTSSLILLASISDEWQSDVDKCSTNNLPKEGCQFSDRWGVHGLRKANV